MVQYAKSVDQGLSLIHIYIHSGSWTGNSAALQKAVNLINAQHADLVLFTGDLGNNVATEDVYKRQILIIGDKKDPEYWKDENAQTIINAFKTKRNAAGYTAVDKDDADLGLQVSYVASTYYVHGYYNDGP